VGPRSTRPTTCSYEVVMVVARGASPDPTE
jgi:hypothetical protein